MAAPATSHFPYESIRLSLCAATNPLDREFLIKAEKALWGRQAYMTISYVYQTHIDTK